MIESTIPGLCVEDLQEKIKAEIEKSDANALEKASYRVEDLLHYHDAQFISMLYRVILQREPDAEGFDTLLQQLRSGQRSELELLIGVRYSPEGRAKGVSIAGLSKRRFLARVYRLPLIGYIVQLLTIPRYITHINALQNRVVRLEDEMDTLLSKQRDYLTKSSKKIDELHTLYDNLEQTKTELTSQIDTKADKFTIELPEFHEEQAPAYMSHAIEGFGLSSQQREEFNQSDLYYLLFENVFYNHHAVKEKQKIYLPYIQERATSDLQWLDIGCGRGEFMEILTASDISTQGVEINTIEYETLKSRGFEVSHDDAVSFLGKSETIYRGISALQVVEHLEYAYLKDMLRLSYEKIAQGGMIILETINPRNELGLANFYMDETHKRPLPAEMMAFLLEWMGFVDVKIVYSALLSDNYHRNSEIRNNYHDYAVIGYKR